MKTLLCSLALLSCLSPSAHARKLASFMYFDDIPFINISKESYIQVNAPIAIPPKQNHIYLQEGKVIHTETVNFSGLPYCALILSEGARENETVISAGKKLFLRKVIYNSVAGQSWTLQTEKGSNLEMFCIYRSHGSKVASQASVAQAEQSLGNVADIIQQPTPPEEL